MRSLRREADAKPTQKQDKMDIFQEGVGANLCEKLERIIYPVDSWVFLQILRISDKEA